MRRLLLSLAFLLLASPGWATIAHDAYSEYTAGDPGDFLDLSWTHTPSGTPAGVIVYVMQGAQTNNTDAVVSVTYGGDAMSELASSPSICVNCTSEFIIVLHAYFLGEPKADAQTVFVENEVTQDYIWAAAYTVTSATNNAAIQDQAIIDDANSSSPAATLSLSSVTSAAFVFFGSGENATTSISPLTSWTQDAEYDTGSQTYASYSYDTIGSTDVTCGWNQSSDEAHGYCVAITEAAATGGAAPSQLMLMGVGD